MRPTLFHKKPLPHYYATGAHTELESHLRQTHEMARS
jgi:hypothetical protein